jgi:hypothetical protein
MSDIAAKAAIDEKKGKALGVIEVDDEKFDIIEKPDALLLAELARTGSEDPEAFGVIAEFFEFTLGKAAYARFKKTVRAARLDDEALMGKLQEVLEKTMGRPTE